MDDKVQLHSVEFFQPKQFPIRCMSYNKESLQLAVSRSDSSIEIWDFQSVPYLEKIIPENSQISVETLTWFQGRLLSAGLEGHIVEYDLKRLSVKNKLSVVSCASIWCMKVSNNGKYLAVGNDDGHVALHEFNCGELTFLSKFKKQEGSILCLDWHKNDEKIVTGSLDVIRIWDVSSGCVLDRIILGRAAKNRQTVVWCIAVLSDMTIVSGDSCGKTSFWDGNTGSLISQSNTLKDCKADVLTLIVSDNEKKIYSSGVDPVLTIHQKSESSGLWIRSIEKGIHSHDVRCLVFAEDSIVSGGDDCKMHVLTRFQALNYSSLCQRTKKDTFLAENAHCLLMNHTDHLTIAKLSPDAEDGFKILMAMITREGESIISCALSANGKWLAFSSTLNCIRLYATDLDWPTTAPSAKKMTSPKSEKITHPVTLMLFSPNSAQLIVYSGHYIHFIKCGSEPVIEDIIEQDTDEFRRVELMEISPNGLYLACGTVIGSIIIFNLKTLKVHCKLPTHEDRPTAMKFDPASENLVAVYSNREIVEYSLLYFKYTFWCKSDQIGLSLSKLDKISYPITSIVFLNGRTIFQDESYLYTFRRDGAQLNRKRKNDEYSPFHSQINHSRKFIGKMSNLFTYSNGLLAVRIPEKIIDESLPPPIMKKKFGT